MNGTAARLRLLVRRHGAARTTISVVAGIVASSVALTWFLSLAVLDMDRLDLALGIAFAAPLLLSPPVVWAFVTLVRTLDDAERDQRQLAEDLSRSLEELRTLRGLLPICASCKAVRDDTGYWHAVETFLREHSEARVSHSLCPDCVRTHHPELADAVLGPRRA